MSFPQNVPTVEVMLDRPRRIAFTLGAMKRIKQVTGKAVADEGDVQIVDVIGPYIWAMLTEEDRKDVTVEQIEDMIHFGNLNDIIAAFNQVVGESSPAGKVEVIPAEAMIAP